MANTADLVEELESTLVAKPTDEWMNCCSPPASRSGPIRTYDQVFDR